jgi:hypothetical protein
VGEPFETRDALLGLGRRFICKGFIAEGGYWGESMSGKAGRFDGKGGGWRDILRRSWAAVASLVENTQRDYYVISQRDSPPRVFSPTRLLTSTFVRATTVSMPTPETPPSSPLTVQSDTTSASVPSGGVFVAPDTRRPAAYIELPHLAPEERVKYEPVSNRDLPQDFDYGPPLSDRVIIGEYRDDDATLWYYVENADGIAHRVSVPLYVPMLAGDRYLPSKPT